MTNVELYLNVDATCEGLDPMRADTFDAIKRALVNYVSDAMPYVLGQQVHDLRERVHPYTTPKTDIDMAWRRELWRQADAWASYDKSFTHRPSVWVSADGVLPSTLYKALERLIKPISERPQPAHRVSDFLDVKASSAGLKMGADMFERMRETLISAVSAASALGESREKYLARDIFNGVAVKDINKRWRWDVWLMAYRYEAPNFMTKAYGAGLHDEHVDSALKRIIKPIEA